MVGDVVLAGAATAPPGDACSAACEADIASCWVLAIRLLYAGQPLQPAWPPVPLHRPPPGQVPSGGPRFAAEGSTADDGEVVRS